MRAVSLTSYKDRVNEMAVWVEVTNLVVLMEDGTLWRRRANFDAPWEKLHTP